MSRVMKMVPFVVLSALIIAVPSAWANWVQNGMALCTATGDQEIPQIISDGVGGALVAWYDNRNGSYYNPNYDIYVQRVNASGAVQWTANGVALCTATGDQNNPTITSDGAGGAIVTWEDLSSGSNWVLIYASRVDASGAVRWTSYICTATGDRAYPTIVSDGAGGAIVTWEDCRSGGWDIYAQRVDSSGAVQWAANGVALCTATQNQYLPTIVSDGSGGAIVTWEDYRPVLNRDIYAQRVNASGAVQWVVNGVALCTAGGDQEHPVITSDDAGGAIVTWRDERNSNIYAQRVNASGTVQWTANGIAVSTAATTKEYPAITPDGAGGAIVTWFDYLSGAYDIYAQRVDASGTLQWTGNGVALCTAPGDQYWPTIVSDGSGGALVAWYDYRNGNMNGDIYSQRVDASGAVQWAPDGVALCTATSSQLGNTSTSDGVGGAIVTWMDFRSGNWDIYAQRVDAAGHTVVATLLQDYAVAFSETGIALTWTLSEVDEGTGFFVERAPAPSGPFIERPSGALRRDGLSFSYIDGDWEPGTTYWFHVGYSAGGVRTILFESGPVSTPAMPLTLLQNHPNPFNPSTEIRYYLPENCHVALDVYDIRGALVTRLAEGDQVKGYHSASWAGRDRNGREMSSGVYFYRMRAGKTEISRKMVLAR